jgi:hypothetical protein
MLPDLRLNEEYFERLMAWDEELARRVAAARCPHCGGPLHRANYERKPRGGLLAEAGEAFRLRHSLCCGWEGCRRRSLPPSLRFLGRRVYLEAVVLLATMVVQLAALMRNACAHTAVPRRTLRRWQTWWRESLPGSRTWVEAAARFAPPPPDDSRLPQSLVERLDRDLAVGDAAAGLVDVCLLAARLLAPSTTSIADAARFVRAAAEHLRAAAVTQKMAF